MCAWLDELQRGHYVAGCRCIFLTETATNVVRVVARCATTDGGKWVGLVSDLALRSHSRRTAHRLVGGDGVALPRSGPSTMFTFFGSSVFIWCRHPLAFDMIPSNCRF
jgi:hypothetical protein